MKPEEGWKRVDLANEVRVLEHENGGVKGSFLRGGWRRRHLFTGPSAYGMDFGVRGAVPDFFRDHHRQPRFREGLLVMVRRRWPETSLGEIE